MIDRKITIKDIASEAGVSPTLVSFTLNNTISFNGERKYKVSEQTAKRILDVAARHNYKPNNAARSLRSKHSRAIGVVLSDISNKFFSDIARQIEERAYFYNYTVMFGSTDEKVEKLGKVVDSFIEKGIDGLVVVPCEGSESLIKEVVERGIPLVSSMGAGAKTDPTLMEIKDIAKTHHCPLAHMLRKRLHKIGIKRGFRAVFSPEPVREGAMILCEEQNKKSNVGTISYIPALFGIGCASVVIRDLIGEMD